jgi:hypothetical protein
VTLPGIFLLAATAGIRSRQTANREFPSAVAPIVLVGIRGWLFNFGRNAAAAEMLDVVTLALLKKALPPRHCRLRWCAALDKTIDGVVVIVSLPDRN